MKDIERRTFPWRDDLGGGCGVRGAGWGGGCAGGGRGGTSKSTVMPSYLTLGLWEGIGMVEEGQRRNRGDRKQWIRERAKCSGCMRAACNVLQLHRNTLLDPLPSPSSRTTCGFIQRGISPKKHDVKRIRITVFRYEYVSVNKSYSLGGLCSNREEICSAV